ncbi:MULTISPECIES: M60 family metallopeptidase [Bacillus cereus group]|uniref:M60 family metallopeptidase n=1 Tax=Bacillus cereus group TaxID=86661 RepID=UPI0021588569|nr:MULTISPECIES: M60 family metallopeptidase [Bacillus cereus group]MCR6786573.1 M60 family metallopeptidase [Bacillus thuringiensis]MCR6823742.1 M60 family metallopeptidase [Bacillus thuringiensis]MCR6828649.1 M60 family metallopeptidase [Bacillus thuringiensis]MEB9324583.1 M60 family metallopeptidase [Bacillus cereus]MEC3213039.1 M60 family metallopeptidase [Bacillus cereus]
MGNNSKHKTRKILTATATVTMLATGMIFSSDVFAEQKEQQKNLSTSLQNEKSVKSENRTFTVPGKGDVEVLKQQERKSMAFSPYEPTGLYAKPNEQITINVEGNQDIQVYIGTYSYDASWREDSKIKSFTLKPGINTIQSPNGGMIYFYNKQQGGTIRTTITAGGTTTPFFELGKHTKQDLINMLDQYPNAHAVELKGERVLITASLARVKKYLLGSNTDPVQLLKKMDEATRIQDKVAGLSEEQVDKHYVHYVEENHSPDYYMYATSYRTAYVGDAIQYVLDINKFITDGWGPWHEAGHLRQQSPWKFYNMTEVQNNIYSLSVEKAFNQPSNLEKSGIYPKAFQYLEQGNKNYDEISDVFVKLVMLWQLQLAYGEDFYPKLHQLYRDMPSSELPQTDENKKQLFMISASKVAKQNLIPFFEKWGLRPNNDTIQKVAALGYPILTAEIWKGTDSNPIKPDMPNVNNILEGNQFAWSLKGISDFEFAKINFNKSTEEMQVDLKAGVPHHYFNETYASIKVQNASGKVVYNKDIYGNKQQNAESQKVSVKVGDYIELTHLEGVHRATLTNIDNSKQESFGKKAMYEVTKEGLKKVNQIVNPKPDTEAPTQPQGLYASNLTSNSVELKWNPSTDNVGVKEYQVLRDGQLIQTVQGTTFTDQNLTVNKEYKYAVKAVDAAGNTSIQSEILLVKTKDQNVSYEKWDPKKAYTKGDKVEHQGTVYEAVQNHQGNGDPNWIFALSLWKAITIN